MTRENYIPFDKEFLLEQQITAFVADPEKVEDFKKLFEIIEHYFHYETFNLNRNLAQNYALFDPDLTPKERKRFRGKSDFSIFKKTLLDVLERGNYSRINQEALNKSIENSDLIGLDLAIDFDAFKEYELYSRGQHTAKEKVSKFLFWKREVEIEYYDRVMIFLHYKGINYFKEKKVDLKKHPLTPKQLF